MTDAYSPKPPMFRSPLHGGRETVETKVEDYIPNGSVFADMPADDQMWWVDEVMAIHDARFHLALLPAERRHEAMDMIPDVPDEGETVSESIWKAIEAVSHRRR